MKRIIYIASDNSGMEREDFVDWINSFSEIYPEYSHWDFDDTTGGKDNFLDLADYEDLKEIFKKQKE